MEQLEFPLKIEFPVRLDEIKTGTDPSGATYIDIRGDIVYFRRRDGEFEIHRDDEEPAVIRKDGTKEWWVAGKKHGPGGGPAVINRSTGLIEYWSRGKRHREDGPAVIKPNKYEYWYNGIKFTDRGRHEDIVKLNETYAELIENSFHKPKTTPVPEQEKQVGQVEQEDGLGWGVALGALAAAAIFSKKQKVESEEKQTVSYD